MPPVQPNRFGLDSTAAQRYERFVAPLMAPFVAALVERVEPRRGDRVLDVACGTGFVARAVAAELGTTDGVVGADANPAMIDVARSVEPGIEWVVAPADALPLADGGVDVVLCQQGLQFFPDPVGGLRELRRVLRTGGRLAATVWAAPADNPYFVAQHDAVRAAAGDVADGLLAALQPDPGSLAHAATEAGLSGVAVGRESTTLVLPQMPRYAADHLSALPWAQLLTANGPTALTTAADLVTDALSAYRRADGAYAVPVTSWLLTAGR